MVLVIICWYFYKYSKLYLLQLQTLIGTEIDIQNTLGLKCALGMHSKVLWYVILVLFINAYAELIMI